MGGLPVTRRRAAVASAAALRIVARPESMEPRPESLSLSHPGSLDSGDSDNGEDELRRDLRHHTGTTSDGDGAHEDDYGKEIPEEPSNSLPLPPLDALRFQTVPITTLPTTDAPVPTLSSPVVPEIGEVPNHIVFVIDRSGSMSSQDIRPTMPQFSGTHNNRLGCVYEAILLFVRRRMLVQQPDVVSVVLFDDIASVVMESEPISVSLVNRLKDFHPQGGTVYESGLSSAAAILQRASGTSGSQDFHPVIVFLSDGETSSTRSPITIILKMKQDHPQLVVHTIQFGNISRRNSSYLKEMAEAGNGMAELTVGSGTDWDESKDDLRYSSRRGTHQVSMNREELGSAFEFLASSAYTDRSTA